MQMTGIEMAVQAKRESGSQVLKGDRPRADRRKAAGGSAVAGERPKKERRKQVDPTTCERDYSDCELEFMRAMDDYKRRSGRPFPTWSEVLEVVISLGYRQVAEPSEIDHSKRAMP